MHLYSDRLAVIQRPREVARSRALIPSFLFTSLSPHTPKIAFNTELGDFGSLASRPCDCPLGKLGLDLHLCDVRSHDKLTGEGMTLLGSDFQDLLGAIVEEAGGCPDDFQFWEDATNERLARITVALSPRLHDRLAGGLADELRRRLPSVKGGTLAGPIWAQAGTLAIRRTQPTLTKGFKMMPIVVCHDPTPGVPLHARTEQRSDLPV
jgi:hypothetical protein